MATAKYSPYYTYIKPVIQHELVKSFLPYIFSLITISVLIFFAVRPTISTITNLQKNMQDSKDILTKAEQKAQNLSLGKQNLENLSPQTINSINNALPNHPNIPYLIASLQNSLAASASISALQIQPVILFEGTNTTTSQTLGEVNFALNVQGSYSQLLTTLDNLSHASRLINLENVTLNKQQEGRLVLSVSGKAYYLK